MATTLRIVGGPDIVLWFGFRRPTVVGIGVRPWQDVRGGDHFYDDPMMVSARAAATARRPAAAGAFLVFDCDERLRDGADLGGVALATRLG